MKIQLIDCNYRNNRDNQPIIQLFGIAEDNSRKVVRVVDFKPYFYVCPAPGQTAAILQVLNQDFVGQTEVVQRFKPVGYQSKPREMIKLTLSDPKVIRDLREKVKLLPGVEAIFEADIIFRDRFMNDAGLFGMNWVEVPDNWELIDYKDVKPLDLPENKPLRFMSLDIETLPKEDGRFPTPDEDQVILISLAFDPPYKAQKDLVLIAKHVKCQRSDVMTFNDELGMFHGLIDIFREYDPDILLGYNLEQFDLWYLDQRFLEYGLRPAMGRGNSSLYIREVAGKRQASITGRVVIDMLPIIRKNYSYQQYTLKTVAHELLGLEKFDVVSGEMRSLWFSEGLEFARFISYSRRDAVLVMLLMQTTGILAKYIALARASGALLQTVVSGGQSVMLESMLLRRFMAKNRVMGMKPDYEEGKEDRENRSVEFQGAFVSEPETGLHEHLFLTDMQSLYPSEVISNNICPSTVVLGEMPAQILTDPNGGKFAAPSVEKGILPEMLNELLLKRLAVKKQMKLVTDKKEKDSLDAIQYSYKILLNSAYGYTGYKRSRLFNITVASAVTAYGRETIKGVRDTIENKIGYIDVGIKRIKLHVIYTDTDSAYVALVCDSDITKEDAEQAGIAVAKKVSEPMPYPKKLNYEGYARRALFLAKKRYALWVWERAGNGEWKDKVKVRGIETVRRDWCPLTADTMKKCLDMILKDGNMAGAQACAKESIKLVRGMHGYDSQLLPRLTLTRKYSKSADHYKTKAHGHAQLVERMKLRGDVAPLIGDRIPYLVVVGKVGKMDKSRQGVTERAESLDFIIKHGLKIDKDYYVEKQLLKPLVRLLKPFGTTEMDLDPKGQKFLLEF